MARKKEEVGQAETIIRIELIADYRTEDVQERNSSRKSEGADPNNIIMVTASAEDGRKKDGFWDLSY